MGDFAPPPQDLAPTVSILSPPGGSTFNFGASISFLGTASDPEDGDLSASLVWTSSRDGQIGTGGNFSTATLSSGIHTITASVTDSGGNPASATISITVGTSSQPTTVEVSSIRYGTQGSNLLITVATVNEFGSPVAGATVSVLLMEWLYTGWIWTAEGTTNTQGEMQFQLTNAPYGCYTTQIKNLVAAGLTWNGITPDNWFCK